MSYTHTNLDQGNQSFKAFKSIDAFNMVSSNTTNAQLSHTTNFIYKGWILALQDESTLENLKWLPKYLVVNKLDKTAFLYDSEATANNVSSSSSPNECENNNNNIVRFDNGVSRDTFINQWRNKSDKFEAYYISSNKFSAANSPAVHSLPHQHHLSNKDIELLDKETTYSNENDLINNTTAVAPPSSNSSAFRFAGFFFKRDKSEKVKHSTLKRAKSGIQLERKKQANSSHTNTLTLVSDSAKSSKTNPPPPPSARPEFEANRLSLQSQMRPSRSHESLSSPVKTHHLLSKKTLDKSKLTQTPSSSRNSNSKTTTKTTTTTTTKRIENIVKLNLNSDASPDDSSVSVNPIHTSLLNEENCFELKCPNSILSIISRKTEPATSSDEDNQTRNDSDDYDDDYEDDDYADRRISHYDNTTRPAAAAANANEHEIKYNSSEFVSSRYFMCRTSDERDKWMQCMRNVVQPNVAHERHCENSLQVWLLEAKGQAISSKPTKKYFCEILLNNLVNARTCSKPRKDILFWGENFDFNVPNCNYVRVELYQESTETLNSKRKSKKEKDQTNSKPPFSSLVHSHSPNHTLLGYVNIPVTSIESSQPVEKWYRLENHQSTDSPSHASNSSPSNEAKNGIYLDPASTSSLSSTASKSISNSASFGSLTTTQNFSKDAISIRIKAKYQSIDILPLRCYSRLVEHVRANYLELMLELEPHLNVRIKDDLANSFVRIAHKLQIQTKFLTDLVMAEVLHLEDSSLTFRGNSLATKSMESYMKLVGENYLKQTLSDCVRSIIETTPDLEIDPSKVANQSSLHANREELVQILHLVCGRVFNSCVHFPLEIKQVFACLRTACKKNGKTDEMCDTLISASIFLRLICPAILSPNLFNLTQEYPQEKAARKLTLAAKTLQTIANFSKFGGKESYMSFDKMNQFVDEHTSLMREFLRNISTLSEEEDSADYSSIVSLTPQTPNMSRDYDDATNKQKCNSHFDLDMIDLAKQLSILHGLLLAIIGSLDEPTKSKFNPELIQILNDLNEMKLNNNFELLNRDEPVVATTTATTANNKLYLYENRLHQAIIKNQQQPLQIGSSSTSYDLASLTSSQPDLTRDGSAQHYSSQYNLVDSSFSTINNMEQAKKLESEINVLKMKLRETEISLKKEQTEKNLIESKLKQQQHNNDQQMREIIQRLIKVEEELRKEQLEMHKVLRAKQELIEIQKKRIEYLSNRSSSSYSIANNNNNNKNSLSTQQKQQSLNHSMVANYNNKLKQFSSSNTKLNKTLNSNEPPKESGITTALSSVLPAASSTSPSSSISLPITTSLKLNENLASQIAASPSSSASSMTQFCNYLAAASLNQTANAKRQNYKLTNANKLESNLLVDALSSTSSSSSGLSNSSSLNHLNQNNQTHTSVNILRHSEL